jgi:hypothetical protein
MNRRERMFGIAEKLPKRSGQSFQRRKVIALETRRARKRH